MELVCVSTKSCHMGANHFSFPDTGFFCGGTGELSRLGFGSLRSQNLQAELGVGPSRVTGDYTVLSVKVRAPHAKKGGFYYM